MRTKINLVGLLLSCSWISSEEKINERFQYQSFSPFELFCRRELDIDMEPYYLEMNDEY